MTSFAQAPTLAIMLLAVTAALVAFSPLSPMLPLTVDVTTPDGFHHVVPIDNTNGRLIEVCADRADGAESVCADVVVEHGRARATFARDVPIDGELRVVLSAPDALSGGATSIAIGFGVLTGAVVGGAVIAETVRSNEIAAGEAGDGAGTAAVGLWFLSGAAAVGTGVAVAFAIVDGAPQSE